MITVKIDRQTREVAEFLSQPLNLRLWTVHRNLYEQGNVCLEMTGPASDLVTTRIEVSRTETDGECLVGFRWTRDRKLIKSFTLHVTPLGNSARLTFEIPAHYPEKRRPILARLIALEFELLSSHLTGKSANLSADDARFMHEYHLAL